MPIYEYKCDGCLEVFEIFQKISDPPPAQHTCGSTAVHRVLSHTSFVLKGTGWYATDYAKKDAGSESAPKKPQDTDTTPKATNSGPDKKDPKAGGNSGSTAGS